MIVSIDYDNTFSADPVAWEFAIAALRSRGHVVICVTARQESQASKAVLTHELPNGIPIVFSGDQAKEVAAIKHGYLVDVWIDDRPERVKAPWFPRMVKSNKPQLAGRYRR